MAGVFAGPTTRVGSIPSPEGRGEEASFVIICHHLLNRFPMDGKSDGKDQGLDCTASPPRPPHSLSSMSLPRVLWSNKSSWARLPGQGIRRQQLTNGEPPRAVLVGTNRRGLPPPFSLARDAALLAKHPDVAPGTAWRGTHTGQSRDTPCPKWPTRQDSTSCSCGRCDHTRPTRRRVWRKPRRSPCGEEPVETVANRMERGVRSS